MRREWKFNL